MGFLAKLLSSSDDSILTKPGDELNLRVTKTERKVATYHSGDGKNKYSRTEYPNGTVHETRTTRKDD